MPSSKQSIIIIGSGWAGATLSGSLDENKYSITVISPQTTTPYTPLLASAACGLYDFSLVETPIRHTGKKIKFIKAVVKEIDFGAKTVRCSPAFSDKVALPVGNFELGYDIVVIAPGVSPLSSLPLLQTKIVFAVCKPDIRDSRRSRKCVLP
jgi:NADH:ubiquinone reductase (non-electrogenic)